MRVRSQRSEYGSHFDDVDRSAHDGVCNTGLYKYSQEKVSHFQLQFPRIHDRQSSLYVVDSGQYSADEVTRMKILSYLSML